MGFCAVYHYKSQGISSLCVFPWTCRNTNACLSEEERPTLGTSQPYDMRYATIWGTGFYWMSSRLSTTVLLDWVRLSAIYYTGSFLSYTKQLTLIFLFLNSKNLTGPNSLVGLSVPLLTRLLFYMQQWVGLHIGLLTLITYLLCVQYLLYICMST